MREISMPNVSRKPSKIESEKKMLRKRRRNKKQNNSNIKNSGTRNLTKI
jgi:hypothetical protein